MFTPHSFPGVKPAEYDEKTHGEVLVIVQIESRPGVENVEEIAKVEGLDVLFIGEIGYSSLGLVELANTSSCRTLRPC